MRSVSRLYVNLEDAVMAADDLIAAGFDPASISVIAPHTSQSLGFDSMDDMAVRDDPDSMAAGAAVGASVGAVLGGATGLLMGLGLLIIPGIGPALAIGPLASAIVGLSLGGATGGITGALVRAGVPPLESNEYSLALRRGESLVFLQVPDDRVFEAGAILDRHEPVGMVSSRAERLEGGHDRRMRDVGPEYRTGRPGDRRLGRPIRVRRDDSRRTRDDYFDEA